VAGESLAKGLVDRLVEKHRPALEEHLESLLTGKEHIWKQLQIVERPIQAQLTALEAELALLEGEANRLLAMIGESR
jgi:hypothetical protein